jgi:hypothetical protein
MNLKNQIVNYFVFPSPKNGVPEVVRSPITINSLTAKVLIEKQFKEQIKGRILHVCYDVDSGILYLPNASGFSKETLKTFLDAAKFRISKDFESGYKFGILIRGSPFSSLRVRSINSFDQAKEIIRKHHENIDFENLPVIEAYLSRMPTTLKLLPQRYRTNEEFIGGYVGMADCHSVAFVEEIDIYGKKLENPITLLTLKPPFILIDISKTKKKETPSATEKESVVLSGYRDHLYSKDLNSNTNMKGTRISQFADLYAINRYLYLGWPFEEVCSLMLRDKIQEFGELIRAIDLLTTVASSLEKEGYGNPASIPYYMTFKIGSDFPLRLSSVTNMETGIIDIHRQYQNFLILDCDIKSDYILIRSPVFISPLVCRDVLRAKSNPFICKYNSVDNTIDIKSVSRANGEIILHKRQLALIEQDIKNSLDDDLAKTLKFRNGESASGHNAIDPNVFVIRKVSDYYYATDIIKNLCQKYEIPFNDLQVIIGPIERYLGSGVHGGFMSKRAFKESKFKAPIKLTKNIYLTPPVILLDSCTYPSYADQAEVLIHEYSHFVYESKNPRYQNEYNKEKGQGHKHWYLYFSDLSEKLAHKNQIKFEFMLGKSYDEIIRNKVGGEITTYNYPIALNFSELVKEAMIELEKEI